VSWCRRCPTGSNTRRDAKWGRRRRSRLVGTCVGSPPPAGLDVERRLWILEQIGLDADEGITTRGGLRGQHEARRRYLDLLARSDCP
jgi:hypothetical protein